MNVTLTKDVKVTMTIPAKQLQSISQVKEYVLDKLQKNEKQVWSTEDGYIVSISNIKNIEFSNLNFSKCDGSVTVNVLLKALVINPCPGEFVECMPKESTAFYYSCTGPLQILIPKDETRPLDLNQPVTVQVIEKKVNIFDNVIKVLAKVI